MKDLKDSCFPFSDIFVCKYNYTLNAPRVISLIALHCTDSLSLIPGGGGDTLDISG